jgi:cytoskeletal protein CcmA (bactofilin family)
MRIDGTLIGSVNAKGKVVIGTTGSVDGEIVCMNGDFSGTVKAQVSVTELLQLKATSKLTGDLVTGKLAIEPGAKFSGTCNMQESTAKPENILVRPNDERPKATT